MIPNFTIGSRTISAYMICTLIGIFAAGIVTLKNAEKKGNSELLTVLLWSAPGVIIGGHLLFAVTNIKYIIKAIIQGVGFFSVLSYFSGNVFYGGMLGGILSSVLYCKLNHIDCKKYIDDAALFIPLFHFFGRIGCFLSGCCYGMECDIGFVYRYSLIESANHVMRFPIQLVEAAGNLVIFVVLYTLYKTQQLQNRLLYQYFLMYSILRFTTEFFRGDAYRGFLFSLSTSQIISIVLFIIGIYFLVCSPKKDY